MNDTQASRGERNALLDKTQNISQFIDNEQQCINNETINELFGTLSKAKNASIETKDYEANEIIVDEQNNKKRYEN